MKPLIERLPPIFAECLGEDKAYWAKGKAMEAPKGYWLYSQPWIADGYAYATTGHLIIRMPWPGRDTTNREGAPLRDRVRKARLAWSSRAYEKEPVRMLSRPKVRGQTHWPRDESAVVVGMCDGHQVWMSMRYYRLLRKHKARLFMRKKDWRRAMRVTTEQVVGLVMPVEGREEK